MRNHGVCIMMLGLAGLLGACASTPENLRGEFAEVTPARASAEDVGTGVRWGGRVLSVTPERDRTCLQILSLPLDGRARPERDAAPGSRFLACREGFLEPAAFPEDRRITVTGKLQGFERRPVGDYDYRFPVLDAEQIHLWPEVRAARRDYRYHGYHGFHGFHGRHGHHSPFHHGFGHPGHHL